MPPTSKRPVSMPGLAALSMLLLAAITAGCGGSGGEASSQWRSDVDRRPADGGTAMLKFFEGDAACARLEAHIEDSLIAAHAGQLEHQRDHLARYGSEADAGSVTAPAPPSASAPSAGSSHSTTTVRTAGVDEADPVKNDGRRILTLKRTAEATVLSRIDLAGAGRMALTAQARWPLGNTGLDERVEGLYLLDGDRALALTTSGSPYAWPMPMPMPAVGQVTVGMPYGPDNSQPASSRVRLVDLASPTLATTWETSLPGALLGSRRIGDRLYLVTQASPVPPEGVRAWVNVDFSNRGKAIAAINEQLAKNEQLIRSVDLATWLAPIGQVGQPSAADCATYAQVDAPSRVGFLRVTSIDVASRTVSSRTALGQANGLYMSGRSLILLSADWDGQGALTYLHRFVADDANETGDAGGTYAYHGSGMIEGQLINHYAIDETEDGVIRVAARNARSSYLMTLAPEPAPSRWRRLGRSGEIAPGETLQSARFVGDRAYLVTFLQIDPFFVYDLSDPARPTALGELKIPGFSTWLHPVGPNHVLGVGYGEGMPREIKASLFDVTDPRQPREQSTLVLGSSYTASDALWDPHAFTWYSPLAPIAGLPSGGVDGTFSIPIRSYAWAGAGLADESGIRIVSVRPSAGAAALALNGSISLTDQLGAGSARPWEGWRPADARRAVFVDSAAYAIADGVIRSAPIATPAATIETLVLP